MTRLLENCQIAPPTPHGLAEERDLPLTFFDMNWIPFHPIRRLFFYDFPCSNEYFLETLVPKLKQSLSVALKHYFPLAGSLVYPLDSENKKPVIRYVPGDSVLLTIVESSADFDNLVGNHARDADQFYDFIPELPPIWEESSFKLLQVLAVQVTLFPGRGICIGVANHHVAGDAHSLVNFIRSWADVCKHGGDEEFLTADGKSLPLFDRSLVNEPPGASDFYWNLVRHEFPLRPSPFPLPTNRVRATYVLGQPEIKKFKGLLLERGLVHVSSFVVTAAYTWTCLAKSLTAGEEEKLEHDEETFFLFAVDARSRLDPPVPENYFGNCLAYGLGRSRHREVAGDKGFFSAAEAISTEIQYKVNDTKKLMANVENWFADIQAAFQKRIVSVSGSARVDLYEADFGWGKTRKLETLSIDGEKCAMSLCKARGSDGGLEIGLSLPKVAMDAFAAAFADGLKG